MIPDSPPFPFILIVMIPAEVVRHEGAGHDHRRVLYFDVGNRLRNVLVPLVDRRPPSVGLNAVVRFFTRVIESPRTG